MAKMTFDFRAAECNSDFTVAQECTREILNNYVT